MEAHQLDNGSTFYVALDYSPEYMENAKHIIDTFGSSPSKSQVAKRERAISEYQTKYVAGSAAVAHAHQLDPNVKVRFREGLAVYIYFEDPSAAMLFKLTYC